MESVCCFSSFPRITPKGTIPNFVWYAGTEIFSAFSQYNMYSWAQSVEGVGGGGGEVVVLGRFGVAERVIGVEVEPERKETGLDEYLKAKGTYGAASSSTKSSATGGTKGVAAGSVPDIL